MFQAFVYSPLIEVCMLLVSRIGVGDMFSTSIIAGGANLRAYTVR